MRLLISCGGNLPSFHSSPHCAMVMGDGSKRRATSQGNRQDKGGGVPLPFTESSVRKAISDLNDGTRCYCHTSPGGAPGPRSR